MTDLYIYTNNTECFNKCLNIQGFNKHHLNSYHNSGIKGIVSENIFFRIFNNSYQCKLVSKYIENPNNVYGIIIKPSNYKKTIENFIIQNIHNPEYICDILENNYYYILERSKINEIQNIFNKKYNKIGESIFKIEDNFKTLIHSKIPFPYIVIDESEIDNFIKEFDVNKFKNSKIDKPIHFIDKEPISIKYLSFATIGMGDFIQRFERLYKLLNYSLDNFIPIKNKNYSYNNMNHGGSKYLTMYDFPGYSL